MRIIAFSGPLTIGKWAEHNGGFNREYEKSVQDDVNEFLHNCHIEGYRIADIKVNHFTTDRHNNGGYDEVWVQYTIMYEGAE